MLRRLPNSRRVGAEEVGVQLAKRRKNRLNFSATFRTLSYFLIFVIFCHTPVLVNFTYLLLAYGDFAGEILRREFFCVLYFADLGFRFIFWLR